MSLDILPTQTTQHLNRILKPTGHARFRRSPSCTTSNGPSTSTQSAPALIQSTHKSNNNNTSCSKSLTDTTSSSSRSSNSSLLEEASVSNGRQFSGLGIVAPTMSFSSRKPPLPASHRKRCHADLSSGLRSETRSACHSHSSCHCCKRRKTSSRREIKRVPITGSKVTSVPADDYSWKKYGEKRITGSNCPRVYYKCNTGKGCPARKSVELAIDDANMLIVTYASEHIHRRQGPMALPAGLTNLIVQSK